MIYESEDSSDDETSIKQKNDDLKKSFYCHREYDDVTLNPKWTKKIEGKDIIRNGVFYLPLPCPKKIILSSSENVPHNVNNSTADCDIIRSKKTAYDYNDINDNNDDNRHNDKENKKEKVKEMEPEIEMGKEKEKEDQYNRACKSLLEFWGQGSIKIQIVDGERFNEDIFMGEVSYSFNEVKYQL